MRAAQKAFTLIELLIVVSLITIITGALLPSFNNYIDAQNVKQAQEQVEDELRTLQNKALNGENASVELASGQVEYWGVDPRRTNRHRQFRRGPDSDRRGNIPL